MKNILSFIVFSFILISCNTTPTVQEYIVKNQENEQFDYIDVSSNLLQIKQYTESNQELNDILKSIKKINVLYLKDKSEDVYKTEEQKLSNIIKKSDYKLLTKIDMKPFYASILYLGDKDTIDEVLLFTKSKENRNFILFRVLGDNINLSKISAYLRNIKINKNSQDFAALKEILNNF